MIWFKDWFHPKEYTQKGKVFKDDDGVEKRGTVSRLAFLEIEETKTVDDANDSVVKSFFPDIGAKVSVLTNDPAGHDKPMKDCKETSNG